MASRPRILVATPHSAECTFLSDWLVCEGFEPVRVGTAGRVAEELRDRPFDLAVVDASFAFHQAVQALKLIRARNPQTPILVIGDPEPADEAQALARGAMYLARPVDRAMLVCTVAMAVMESRPVRRSERKRARFDVVVEGVPSQIIDVSREGLRLEIPRGRKAAPPPPFFNVRVPLIGVALMVRRMWTCRPPDPCRDASWYGGELARNSPRTERAWLSLVEAVPGAATTLEIH
ncbi:MAG TPA: hypothetical protein VD833_19010 [Vicinamibacterales bacterium]|nr:hypothetical protein [Vicinamibacterales bacterium]